MRTLEIKVYKFTELDDRAKEKARDWYREHALDYDWWEYLYEDAKGIGLKIMGFDLGRSQSLDAKLFKSIGEVCALIVANHGKECSTYKLAQEYYRRRQTNEPFHDEDFLYALKQEYWALLNQEMEYLLSNEAVDESIEANDYEFTESGKLIRGTV